jgi:dTDP-L-rhamnose 4-epimerase
MQVLVTGGAGFIGCHLSRALLAEGYEVRVLDRFVEQVHGGASPSDPVLRSVDLVDADIRDADAVAHAIRGVDKVVHLAAEVGVGQSMYEIDRYVGVNDLGTAVLLKALLAEPVQRVVVASSMRVYGEGLYRKADGEFLEEVRRPAGGA